MEISGQPKWPPTDSQTRPWTRWWWHGSAVNADDLGWNLEEYRKKGLGGVEITPIYGIRGEEGKHVPYLSREWLALFDHTLREANRLGLGVDIAQATGWPFGGPWITEPHASKTLHIRRFSLKAGDSLPEPVIHRRGGLVRTANGRKPDPGTMLSPPAANADLQALALDQVQYPGTMRLEGITAHGEKGEVIELSRKVDPHGRLLWRAPPGDWNLYALFSGLHGKMVERAAPGGEGYAIDHFSRQAAQQHLARYDSAFEERDLAPLRGFFNDSYEVDDASGQSNWTPGLPEDFRRTMGYDLLHVIPYLNGEGGPDSVGRVRYDFRVLMGERILHEFTREWVRWGHARGKLLRNQSHGSPANTLDLYASVDIPETEGTQPLRFRFASSAAHVSGKRLVSAEAATWLDEHFRSTLGDVKKAVDGYFLGGVNHIVYHGTAYTPKDAPWPGRLFYAAVHLHPSDPQWRDFDALNRYVTRVQSFLQQGSPDNPILLHYPIADRYASPEGPLLQHFDGMERNFEGTGFEEAAQWMLDSAHGFDFFSDRQLQGFTCRDGTIRTGGNAYRAILVPEETHMDIGALQGLLRLSAQGATILVHRRLPTDVPGLHRLQERRALLKSCLDSLRFQNRGRIAVAEHGRGRWHVADDLGALLRSAGLKADPFGIAGFRTTTRVIEGRRLHFVVNGSDTLKNAWVRLQAGMAGRYHAFDAETGEITVPNTRRNRDGTVSVRVQLRPHASLLLLTADRTSAPRMWYETDRAMELPHRGWQVEFPEGGPFLPAGTRVDSLRHWTEIPGQGHGDFSGTAVYSTCFAVDVHRPRNWILDLGKLSATAEVLLNGRSLGKAIGPSYRVRLPAEHLRIENLLEVRVSNTMANRIAYMDRNGIPWKVFHNINMAAKHRENLKDGVFDAARWHPLPSGLAGPVRLIETEH